MAPITSELLSLLPPHPHPAPAPRHQRIQKPPKAKPSLTRRVGTLANTLSQHAMQTAGWALRQGHSLAMWIPGVAPLVRVWTPPEPPHPGPCNPEAF